MRRGDVVSLRRARRSHLEDGLVRHVKETRDLTVGIGMDAAHETVPYDADIQFLTVYDEAFRDEVSRAGSQQTVSREH
jgi:hypothetical protein